MRPIALCLALTLSCEIAQAQTVTASSTSEAIGLAIGIPAFVIILLPYWVSIEALKEKQRPNATWLGLSYVASFMLSSFSIVMLTLAGTIGRNDRTAFDWMMGLGMASALTSTVSISLTIAAHNLPDRTLVVSAAVPLP